MNSKIRKLTKQAQDLSDKRDAVLDKLQAEYNLAFAKDKRITAAIAAAESSEELTFEESGLSTWTRVSWLHEIQDTAVKNFLESYVAEFGIHIDWSHECFACSIGGYLQVNDEGVYDTDAGKFVILAREYSDGEIDEVKRNQLIEAYMERNGYFPAVVRVDRHDNAFFIKTTPAKEGETHE